MGRAADCGFGTKNFCFPQPPRNMTNSAANGNQTKDLFFECMCLSQFRSQSIGKRKSRPKPVRKTETPKCRIISITYVGPGMSRFQSLKHFVSMCLGKTGSRSNDASYGYGRKCSRRELPHVAGKGAGQSREKKSRLFPAIVFKIAGHFPSELVANYFRKKNVEPQSRAQDYRAVHDVARTSPGFSRFFLGRWLG